MARGPLAGIRVVELASYITAPFAAMGLADLGADVIKVEPPRGDPYRRVPRSPTGTSPVFTNANRGKRSLALDLKDADGIATVKALLATADLLVCNYRPGVLDRMGLPDADLVAANPRLIRIYVSGYGPDGPDVDAPAFDGAVQARVGLTHLHGEPGRPKLAPGYVVDKTTAMMVLQAMLAALYHRERSGIADRVDLAMLDANAYFLFPDAFSNRTYLEHQPPNDLDTFLHAPRPVATATDWMVVIPVTGAQTRVMFEALGVPEAYDEVLEEKSAEALAKALFDRVEAVTKTAPLEHWLEKFREVSVPAARCNDFDDHLADPQVINNHLYDTVERPGLGTVREIRYPARFGSFGLLKHERGVPAVGEHTDEIVRELGRA
jgi:crotonobetainyl-CoA:carnitine CoA-transferase CaiB-like acyl-CoA transferase